MLYDYFLIVFVLISFIYGLYRGIKRELSYFIIFSASLFGVLFSYNTILDLVKGMVDITSIYESIKVVTDIIPFSEGYFAFFVLIFLPIILITLLLNGLAYLIFFKRKYNKTKKVTKSQRLFGGLLGIIVGLEMSILMLIVFNGIFDIELSGPATKLIIEYLPNMSQIITETSRLVESEVA